jgi:hypothetical protein
MAGMSRLLTFMVVGLLGMGFAGTALAQDGGGGGMMPEVHTNLYATLEFENFGNTDSAFDARNIELLVNGRMGPRLTGSAEIEFERAKAVGEDAGAVEVEQGWVQYEIIPLINVRTGVILVPFGKFNLTHFDPFRDLTDRPIMARRVIPTTWAEAGAGVVGSFYPTDNSVVDYQVYVVNGLTDMISDKGFRDARGSFGEDNNNNKAVVGRLSATLDRSEVGVSGYRGAYDRDGNQVTGYDVDGMIVVGSLEILGEGAIFSVEQDGLALPEDLMGYYVQANYHFWFDFLNQTFMGRQFDDPTFTLSVRHGAVKILDDGDGAGLGETNNRETRTTVGLNYRPTETYVFKVEFQSNDMRTGGEALERGHNDGVIGSVTAAF